MAEPDKVPQVMHGSRAILWITKNNGVAKAVGIFNNVSYQLNYDTTPVFILGRFNPVEIVITGQEPVTVTASGWRVVDHGPFTVGLPHLGELLAGDYKITLSIVDRQAKPGDPAILEVVDCVAHGFSSSSAAKSIQEMTINFTGIALRDESAPEDADGGAKTYP